MGLVVPTVRVREERGEKKRERWGGGGGGGGGVYDSILTRTKD